MALSIMDRLLPFIFLLSLICVGCEMESDARQPKEEDDKATNILSEIGRYQIISGEYTQLTEKNQILVKAVFKLDTVTGETWKWNPRILGDKSPNNQDFWISTEK